MAATRKTEIRWRVLVREQESSGMSAKEFARSRGLSAATLYWWRSELGRRRAERGAPLRLARVALEGPTPGLVTRGGDDFEVELAGGRRVRVPRDFDAGALRRLIAVLEGPC